MTSNQLKKAILENETVTENPVAGVAIIQSSVGVLGVGPDLESALKSAELTRDELDAEYPSNAIINTNTIAAFRATDRLIAALEQSSDWTQIRFETNRGTADIA